MVCWDAIYMTEVTMWPAAPLVGFSMALFALMVWGWGLEATLQFILYDTILDPILWGLLFCVLLWHHLGNRADDPQ